MAFNRAGSQMLCASEKLPRRTGQPAGLAESAHGGEHRIEKAEKKEAQVLGRCQPALRIFPRRMAGLAGPGHVQPLLKVPQELPVAQILFGHGRAFGHGLSNA